MMESKEIPVVLCFNKEDIATDPQIKELEEIYETCGYPMVFVSAKEERGIEKIRERLSVANIRHDIRNYSRSMRILISWIHPDLAHCTSMIMKKKN